MLTTTPGQETGFFGKTRFLGQNSRAPCFAGQIAGSAQPARLVYFIIHPPRTQRSADLETHEVPDDRRSGVERPEWSECSVMNSGRRYHNSKPVVPVAEVRVVPEADGAADDPRSVVVRAATHHARYVTFQMFVRRAAVVVPPLRGAPFPHVPAHVQRTTLSRAVRERCPPLSSFQCQSRCSWRDPM